MSDPDGRERHTAACIPGSTYVEVERLGHDQPPGHWDRLVAEVSRFIIG